MFRYQIQDLSQLLQQKPVEINASSNAFTVSSGGVSNFLVETTGGGNIPSPVAGTSFNIKITDEM